MSKAAELAALIGSGQAQGDKNLIINGAMNIFQRSTSTASITGEDYPAADRFKTNMSDAGTFEMSQSSTVPSGQGFNNSLKMDCTAADASVAAGSFMSIDHRIEAQNLQRLGWGTSSAKSLTISFWVRSNLTGTYVLEFLHGDAFVYNSNTYTIDAANTWEKKIITISGYTPTAINDDNGIGLYIFWWLQSGSTYSSGTTTNDTWHTTQANRAAGLTVDLGTSTDNEFYLTGVQLEVGEQATAFEHEDYGTTLRKCQRYYYKIDAALNADEIVGSGYQSSSTLLDITIPYQVTMRTYPTALEQTGTATDYKIQRAEGQTTCSAVPTFGSANLVAARIRCTVSSGMTSGEGAAFRFGSTDSYLAWSAEL